MNKPIGVLLINLGTPEATTFWPMRRYLKEFLSDKRVIEARGLVWWLVLNAIILIRRPKKSGKAYRKIWNRELDESPLKTITRAQADKVSQHFADDANIKIDWAMRYAQPPIAEGIERLKQQGCQRILYFPLYPQYSAATTASAMDKVFDVLKSMRMQPAMRTLPPYFEDPLYVEAIAETIISHRENLSWKPQVILASFHGLPKDFITKGDPYQDHCETTVRLLRQAMSLGDEELMLTYQSRSGRSIWLTPDTEETLAKLAGEGIENVMVVAPGFAADCIETLEEIEIRAAKKFLENGGRNFTYVPCLNDSEKSVEMLAGLIGQELSGWNHF